MLIGLNSFREDSALVYGKSLNELKKMSVQLYKRVCELQRFVATGRACWRRPSYSMELTVVRKRLDKVNKLIDAISGYDEVENMQRYPIERFIEAQERNYTQAIAELRKGKKTSHWMWYIFPQLRFLGHSETAYYYGIADEQEAKEYCANSILYDRYIECCKALESIQDANPEHVMGPIDALKLCSSLTLFYMVDEKNQPLYKKLIDKFYRGQWDRSTIDYLAQRRTVEMRLNDQPFQQIRNGEKTVEVRLYDEKRRKIQVGNRIRFIHSENKELQIQARVVALHRYNTFTELFESEEFGKCGFNGMTVADSVAIMYEYYTKEEESKWGVLGIEIELIESEKSGILRYVHGSEDSTDVDVIYVFDSVPTIEECKSFCDGKGQKNGNIIVVKNGVVVFAYKGSVDEVNNALLHTYPLHKQEYPLVIEHLVQRDILLKDIKVIRKILSSLSRTKYRVEIKNALRSNWDEKIKTLKDIDYNSINFSAIPKTNKSDLLKSLAFQIGQAIALHEGKELYTKSAIAGYFPELEGYLQRKETSNDVIIKYIHRFIALMETLPVEMVGEDIVCFGEPFNARYNVNKEERVANNNGA